MRIPSKWDFTDATKNVSLHQKTEIEKKRFNKPKNDELMEKKFMFFLSALTFLLASCNSNDDGVNSGVEIPGITITDDVDCCSADEAYRVYKFLSGLVNVPELTSEIGGKYNVYVFTETGTLHKGYNDLYFVVTKKTTGNYVKNYSVNSITPLMYMVKSGMTHSTPVGTQVTAIDGQPEALRHGWVSLLMNTSESGTWSLSYNVSVLGSDGGVDNVAIKVNALPDGQEWIKSFKVDNDVFFLSLVNPLDWKTGTNEIKAYISKKSSVITEPYALAEEDFVIDIDPRMPDMGNHTSPDNVSLTRQDDGSYLGTVNVTMTGLWRIHLTVRNADGDVVGGGDNEKDGYSSLYWEVTL